MALHYKLPAPHQRFLREDGSLKPEVSDCVLLTMATGMAGLRDEAAAVEHWARACVVSRLSEWGARDEAFPLEVARSLIGLTVNVTQETEASFLRRIAKSALSNLRRVAKNKLSGWW